MKNIIRYFSVAAIAVAIATMVGCTKEDMNNGLTFTTTVEMPANGIKALDGNGHKTFAVGDKIKLTYGSNTIESEPLTADDLSNDNKAARFTFVFEEDPVFPEDMDIMYEYPATFSGLDGQNGTIGYIAEHCDYATWTGKVTSAGYLPGNISLTNQYVILKLKINHGGNDITSTITGLTVANGGNTVSVSPSSLSEIYVAMPAVSTGDIFFTATDGSNNYTKTVTGETLTQGNLYPVNLTMNKVYPAASSATAADYGKVVCNNGHLHDAKTAVPSGCTAVAVFGYISGSDRYAIALQDASDATWNAITNSGSNAGTNCAVPGTWTVAKPDGANWYVATQPIYSGIFQNLGSTTSGNGGYSYDGTSNAFITEGVGGTALSSVYWTTTVYGSMFGRAFNASGLSQGGKTASYKVRPVLKF